MNHVGGLSQAWRQNNPMVLKARSCESSPEYLSSKISKKCFIQIGYWILKPQNFNYVPCILKTKIGIIPKTNSMFARAFSRWLEDDPFVLEPFPSFRGYIGCVRFREGRSSKVKGTHTLMIPFTKHHENFQNLKDPTFLETAGQIPLMLKLGFVKTWWLEQVPKIFSQMVVKKPVIYHGTK